MTNDDGADHNDDADGDETGLAAQYRRRFADAEASREAVWEALISGWFHTYVDGCSAVLDLGCGWGEFINQIDTPQRYGLDLNPDAAAHLDPGVELLAQPADAPWPLPADSLDLVFSSNFLEHLGDRDAIRRTFAEAHRCLRPGGRVVCMGPNIRYAGGAYWDYFDHMVPLTERSVAEALELAGFRIEEQIARFLPFTMVGKPPPPAIFIHAYLRLRPAWRVLGKQFLVSAVK